MQHAQGTVNPAGERRQCGIRVHTFGNEYRTSKIIRYLDTSTDIPLLLILRGLENRQEKTQ